MTTTNADVFKRKSNESLNDWISRIKTHALEQIPGLKPHAATVMSVIDLYGDWKSVDGAMPRSPSRERP